MSYMKFTFQFDLGWGLKEINLPRENSNASSFDENKSITTR